MNRDKAPCRESFFMSKLTSKGQKPLVWLHGEIRTPPFSRSARLEAGYALGRLQGGETLTMPLSRTMPVIGPRCHELRIADRGQNWRIGYRTESDAIVILDVFAKKTRSTPKDVIERCRKRLMLYEQAGGR
jgi:phage-related protein